MSPQWGSTLKRKNLLLKEQILSLKSRPLFEGLGPQGKQTGWMDDDLQFYVLFNSVSVISGQWEVDNERLCAIELCLWFRRFRLERGSNSVC